MTLGEKLCTLRKEKGYNQTDIADKFNLTKSTISMYEQNNRVPPPDVLLKYSSLFNVSVDYLLGKTSDRNAAIISGESIPDELKALGVEELKVAKWVKDEGLTLEQVQKIVKAVRELKGL